MKFLRFDAKMCIALLLSLTAFTINGFAQEAKKPKPTVIYRNDNRTIPVASGNNLYCAGYIQTGSVDTSMRLVGADQEQERNFYAERDFVYVSNGNGQMKVGDVFTVIRPRGKFHSKFSKKGNLGMYVQEVGALEIVNVKNEVSVARVKASCDNFMLGDLIAPMEKRVSPSYVQRPILDMFAEPSGKASGRIVLARDLREMVSGEQIVYVDLGAEDNVKSGDFLTIYHPLGKGGRLNLRVNETIAGRDADFESGGFKGGTFSNQAGRKSGSEGGGSTVTTAEAKSGRPKGLRKVVGELVILNVKERAATALITRNTQEIHTGDMVELQ